MNKHTALAIALATACASPLPAAAKAPDAILTTGVAGRYQLQIAKADADGNEIPGTRRVALDWFDNLIVNNGMDLLGTNTDVDGSILLAARVGTGSTPPVNTDTALGSQLAASTTEQAVVAGAASTAPYFGWLRKTFRFAAGVAAGNISEVGIATGATTGTLFSRALTVDGSGNPITITVLSDELLDVVYELRYYPPATDIAWGPLTISGVSYSGTMRAARANAPYTTSTAGWSPPQNVTPTRSMGLIINGVFNVQNFLAAYETQTLGAITSVPATPVAIGVTNTMPPGTASAYVAGTYYRDHQLLVDLNYANFGTGIGAMSVQTSMGVWQFSFTPKVAKTASYRFTINLRLSWARHVFP